MRRFEPVGWSASPWRFAHHLSPVARARDRSRRVDFKESASLGSLAGHVLGLRVAERLRRIVADAFGLPSERVRLAEHFLTVRSPGPSIEKTLHCDEAVFPHGEDIRGKWRFHFSSVLWLGSAGVDFEGGALAFYSNASKPWLQVDPRLGRAALFSSGWENVHGIRPVVQGERWALTAAFMVHDELLPPPHAGRDFYDSCVRPPIPVSRSSYAQCRQYWAARMTG